MFSLLKPLLASKWVYIGIVILGLSAALGFSRWQLTNAKSSLEIARQNAASCTLANKTYETLAEEQNRAVASLKAKYDDMVKKQAISQSELGKARTESAKRLKALRAEEVENTCNAAIDYLKRKATGL